MRKSLKKLSIDFLIKFNDGLCYDKVKKFIRVTSLGFVWAGSWAQFGLSNCL